MLQEPELWRDMKPCKGGWLGVRSLPRLNNSSSRINGRLQPQANQMWMKRCGERCGKRMRRTSGAEVAVVVLGEAEALRLEGPKAAVEERITTLTGFET